ncbi:23S rRNA (pseudouridine(1915)-N(3))-methyltransferase RlmH [Geofilum sp. OHC36d9]|uniref:23S rRNA (pseudouridine(1915)-N(3))-methyltransferase RlmH n=1 Tax=Geofilum sp. OHC36d9 TaxID=3458413 RepID=UPI004033BBF0
MKTHLIMIGRTDDAWLKTGISVYVNRILRYIPFQFTVVPDVKNGKSLPLQVLKEKEGEALLKLFTPGDMVVLLDEKGKHFASRELASFMERQMLSGVKNLFFVIGGAYGFSDAVYQRAGAKMSLSRMTFSHQMVRLIFAEQLYRAMTIINNEPYHHD